MPSEATPYREAVGNLGYDGGTKKVLPIILIPTTYTDISIGLCLPIFLIFLVAFGRFFLEKNRIGAIVNFQFFAP